MPKKRINDSAIPNIKNTCILPTTNILEIMPSLSLAMFILIVFHTSHLNVPINLSK